MHARVSQAQTAPERLDDVARYVAERLVPEWKRLDGYRGVAQLVDRATGKVATVTFWESEAALDAAEAEANLMRDQAAQDFALTAPLTTARYEVALSELPTAAS